MVKNKYPPILSYDPIETADDCLRIYYMTFLAFMNYKHDSSLRFFPILNRIILKYLDEKYCCTNWVKNKPVSGQTGNLVRFLCFLQSDIPGFDKNFLIYE